MFSNFNVICLVSVLTLAAPVVTVASPEFAVIPEPQTMAMQPGSFVIGSDTKILANNQALDTGRHLAMEMRRRGVGEMSVVSSKNSQSGKYIELVLDDNDSHLGKEGYVLDVEPAGVTIRANSDAGLFYGAETLLQLLPMTAVGRDRSKGWQLPCARIEDTPHFRWRGLMLDVSRHFFSKDEVEELLDEMAWYKLNVFHWHLTDDQGWRVEIKKYPRLTEIGAWRKSIGFGLDPKATTAYGRDGRYGGFYTQDDIREVVSYAQARHITIVPEIELPGHSSAALMAYPQFSCTGGPFTTDLPSGVFNGVYCAGNEAVFTFVEDVLTEICALFPGPYIHVGGDEVPVDNWKKCAKCQARIREEGLTKESDLEGYFIRRVEKFINARGRRLVGWSEIRNGGLAANATVMDWVGGATEAATAGHDVVMSPLADCYFDHYQSLDHSKEPRAIGGYLPLRQVYQFEPMPAALLAQYQSHILGAQANVWTEYMPSFKHVQYMVFPRLCALAEVVWSPKEARNWEDFSRRVRIDSQRLDKLGVNHRPFSNTDEPLPAQEKK